MTLPDIYVKSHKSAERVMTSVTGFIEEELKLKANRKKRKISRPTESTLLGFSLLQEKIRMAHKNIA